MTDVAETPETPVNDPAHDPSDSEDEGDAYRVTEEIEQEEPEERVVIREERYVNEDGKTVIRRVYKKSRKTRKKKKKKKVVKPKVNPVSGFSGIPMDEDSDDDGVSELMKFKLKSRRRDDDSAQPDDDTPEWQKKKLRSGASRDSGNESPSMDDEVFNFRRLLRKRQDSPILERKAKVKSTESPNFLSVLKKNSRTVGDSEPKTQEEEKPNFLSVLKKNTRTDSMDPEPKVQEEGKPNFLGVLKKTGVSTVPVQKEKKEEEPIWRAVKLRAAGTVADTSKRVEEEKPVFGTSILRKTENKALIEEEDRLTKARESELKALERREARLNKEKQEKANVEKLLQTGKLSLQQEVDALQLQKDQLLRDLQDLKSQIAEHTKTLAEVKK